MTWIGRSGFRTPISLSASPAAARLASFISEYLRERITPAAPEVIRREAGGRQFVEARLVLLTHDAVVQCERLFRFGVAEDGRVDVLRRLPAALHLRIYATPPPPLKKWLDQPRSEFLHERPQGC